MVANEQDVTRLVSYEELQRAADMAATIALAKAFPNRSQAVFYLPNNLEGRIVRWILNRYLNRRVFRLRAWGRKPRVRGAGRGRPTIRHDEAAQLAIYIETKKGWE